MRDIRLPALWRHELSTGWWCGFWRSMWMGSGRGLQGRSAVWVRFPAHCWCTTAAFHQARILDNATLETSNHVTSVQLYTGSVVC